MSTIRRILGPGLVVLACIGILLTSGIAYADDGVKGQSASGENGISTLSAKSEWYQGLDTAEQTYVRCCPGQLLDFTFSTNFYSNATNNYSRAPFLMFFNGAPNEFDGAWYSGMSGTLFSDSFATVSHSYAGMRIYTPGTYRIGIGLDSIDGVAFNDIYKVYNVTVEEDHSYGDWFLTKSPTCFEEGVQARYCQVCGYAEDRLVDKTQHTWSDSYETVKEPTCEEPGSQAILCKVCGAVKSGSERAIAKTGHDWDAGYSVDVASTCSKAGSESIHCKVCGKQKAGSERTVDKQPHSFGEWSVTKKATCTSEGSKERHCWVCGETEKATVSKLQHSWSGSYSVDKKPTCKTEGSESVHCKVCGGIKPGTPRVVSKTPHSLSAWKMTKKATCLDAGEEQRTCSACDYSETREVKAAGHSVVVDKAITSTYTKEGKTEGSHCSVCGKVIKAQKATPVLKGSRQVLTVKTKTATVKVKKLKKKAQTVKSISSAKAKGKISYQKISGSSNLSISSSTGKVTVKKKTKKGTYSIKVKVNAASAQGGKYLPCSKTVTLKVKVK